MLRKPIILFVLVPLLVSLACGLPSGIGQSPATTTSQPAVTGTPAADSSGSASVVADAIKHILTPGSPSENPPVYDNESHSTANQKYAANGDIYALNRFERPFTQKDMTYLPYLDIQKFNMARDASWYYASMSIFDLSTMSSGPAPMYAIEIDYDLDGRGDFLIVANPPLSTDWNTQPVSIFADNNRDVGGPHPNAADPANKAGDGYETTLFKAGQGSDPDLAWVRINPADPNEIQFAFKKSLVPGNSFEWDAWADAGIKDPAKFAYNDRMSLADAGSPLRGDPNYPLKGLFAVDDTCYEVYGASTGYLPLICPVPPTPTRKPSKPQPRTPAPSQPPPPPTATQPQIIP